MTSSNDVVNARGAPSRGGIDLSWDSPEWTAEDKPARDWKKVFLVVGLGVLSWVATYVGMLELIEANMGELPIIHKVIIGFSVAMLMTMIIWLLDQMFAPIGWFTRASYVAGYIFLSVISVGFGFGFYWKVLESRSVASHSAEAAVTQVQNALFGASTRLEQLQATLEQLVTVSKQKADIERANGTSCPNSKPGEGPRRRMREEDAARFGFAGDFVKGRIGAVKSEMTALDADLLKIASDDKSIIDARSGTRNEFMKSLGRKLELTATGFNAFRSDPQLKQIRADLAERADRTSFADSRGGTFICPDSQLQAALKGVARAIDELPILEKPKIATVEGSEAVIEAFRRLTATFYGALSFRMPPTAEELRELQKRAMETIEPGAQRPRVPASLEQAGLSKRDYIPLAIAIFVDLCLLLVSMGRPVNRLQGLLPKMRAAERGPVIQILSRFNQIHRDAEIRENFELFRHVVFDFNGDYYVAVPLDAPHRMNPAQREELRLEAALLANLFASFEQERIFSRVLMPLLPVVSIRKKLRRQGSKFAEAEAFRVYKFKSGAWSEIILGAIMGAARRVEAEQRRRRSEEDIFQAPVPSLDAAPLARHHRDQSEAPPVPHPNAREAFASFPGAPGSISLDRTRRSPTRGAAMPSPDVSAQAQQFGPYARFLHPDTMPANRPPSSPRASAWEASERLAAAANSNNEPSGAPLVANPARETGAAAAAVTPREAPSHALGSVAHAATAGTSLPANVISLAVQGELPRPVSGPVDPAVMVEAVERRVTFAMPAGHPPLPATVASLAARSAAIAAEARRNVAASRPALELQPPQPAGAKIMTVDTTASPEGTAPNLLLEVTASQAPTSEG